MLIRFGVGFSNKEFISVLSIDYIITNCISSLSQILNIVSVLTTFYLVATCTPRLYEDDV